MNLTNNTTELQAILDTVNALHEAGSGGGADSGTWRFAVSNFIFLTQTGRFTHNLGAIPDFIAILNTGAQPGEFRYLIGMDFTGSINNGYAYPFNGYDGYSNIVKIDTDGSEISVSASEDAYFQLTDSEMNVINSNGKITALSNNRTMAIFGVKS